MTRLFQAHGTRWRVVAELWSFENMKHFVRQQVGLAIVPRVTVAQELASGALAAVPVEGLHTPRDTYMVFRDPASLSPPARQFLEVVGRFEWDAWLPGEAPVPAGSARDEGPTGEAARDRSTKPARRRPPKVRAKRLSVARPARARRADGDV